MTDQPPSPLDPEDGPATLEELLHRLNNRLASVDCGFVVIEDALDLETSSQVRSCIREMRQGLHEAAWLVRAIPGYASVCNPRSNTAR